mmetsp:Transcript_14863/g.47427  ORF Transcript_14863/g.47427 Transcript_14863/m.47427 type:complete len:267 (-) Transcript_14863:564-1364(-)
MVHAPQLLVPGHCGGRGAAAHHLQARHGLDRHRTHGARARHLQPVQGGHGDPAARAGGAGVRGGGPPVHCPPRGERGVLPGLPRPRHQRGGHAARPPPPRDGPHPGPRQLGDAVHLWREALGAGAARGAAPSLDHPRGPGRHPPAAAVQGAPREGGEDEALPGRLPRRHHLYVGRTRSFRGVRRAQVRAAAPAHGRAGPRSAALLRGRRHDAHRHPPLPLLRAAAARGHPHRRRGAHAHAAAAADAGARGGEVPAPPLRPVPAHLG